jgi:hypothetical protein
LKGSRLTGQITALRFLAPEVALIHSSGGVLRGRQQQLARSAKSVQTLVAVKRDSQWEIAAFQNTRYRPFADTLLGKILARFSTRRTGRDDRCAIPPNEPHHVWHAACCISLPTCRCAHRLGPVAVSS